jgi:TRAP-type C4-dicarboxylate transport system substrate-binding protein
MSPEVLVMSSRAWQALSPEDQVIFRQAAKESSKFMREQWKAWEARAQSQAQKAGNTVVTEFDKAPFQAAMASIYDQALSGDPKLRVLVERIRHGQ